MSYYPNDWPLNLNDDTFNALKTDFNAVLRKTLSNMETKESEVAELTVKLKISLKKEKAPFGEGIPRDIVVPKFDHKVSSVMQIKDELTGSLGGNYELVWDKERGEFVMREIVDGQQTIFDANYEVVEPDDQSDCEADTDGENTPAALTGSKVAGLLPEKTDGDVEKARQSCREGFPECICLACERFDGSCCSEHDRDCRDGTDCIDCVETDGHDDGYQYEEPNEEGNDE